MFKKILGAVFLTLGILGVFFNSQAIENLGAFSITNLKVDILVKKDATLEVKEIIDVNFSEKRHGVFREIPVKYKNDQGFEYNMKLKVLSVKDEKGDSISYEVSSSGADKVLKIGDPDLEIIGNQRYIIKYEIEKGVRYFEDHDEIFWNPIGTGWPTTIARASSLVRFEEGMDYLSESGVCFTGLFGAKEKNCLVKEEKGQVQFLTTQGLNDYEGLTVAVHLPKGEIKEPTGSEYFWMFLGDNWGFGLPLAMFLLMYFVWRKKGKEINLKKTIIAQYEAPNNLTPGEVGCLLKERYSVKFVTADIINLAVKGYLDIFEVESSELKIIKKIRQVVGVIFSVFFIISLILGLGSLLPYLFDQDFSKIAITIIYIISFFCILIFFKKIFKKDTPIKSFDYELENKKDWSKAKDLTDHEKELLRGLFGSKKLGKIKLSDKKNSFYENIQSANTKIKSNFYSEGYFETGVLHSKGFYIVLGIIGGIGMFILGIVLERLDLIFGLLFSSPIIILFGIFMSKKTQKGAEAYWKTKGYKEYIDVAEKHRSEFNAKENIFEKTLPYAMVFGNIDKWAKAFEGISKSQPDWYHSSSMAAFHPVIFASSINEGFSSATQAASVSPQSSSSGSGGSSGGGGGGGGGGSW